MRPPAPRKTNAAAESSRRSQPVMDPYGIYGTRSANRLRAAKKRRQVQGVLWLFSLCGLMGLIIAGARLERIVSISNDWSLELMTRPSGPPVWASANGGTLLMPTESGQLLAGKPASDGGLSPVLQADFPLRAEPLVVGNSAYVACEDGSLYALSLSDSRRQWRYVSNAAMTTRPAYLEYEVTVRVTPTPSPSPRATPSRSTTSATARPESTPGPTPVAAGIGSTTLGTPATSSGTRQEVRKTVVVGNDQGLVSALDAGNGRLRWKRPLPAPVGSGLVAAELEGRSLVLVPLLSGLASRGGLWCLDGRTGAVVWKFPDEGKTLAAQLPAPVVEVARGVGRVYAANDSGAVFCLDLKTGRKTGWQKAYLPPASAHSGAVLLRTEPLLVEYDEGARLIVAGSDGGVHGIDTRSGRIEWSFDVPGAVHSRPLLLQPLPDSGQNPVVIVGSDNADAYALDARSGALVWKLRTPGATVGLVKSADGVLAVGRDGTIRKFTPR